MTTQLRSQDTPRSQFTLSDSVAVDGFGFWSSQDNRIEFHPALPNTGIVFVRTDLPEQPRIPALIANRIEFPLRTTLSHEGGQVEMIEHVMAALAGMQIDNCEVRVSASEMPGLDGSSLPFVKALQTVERVPQDALRNQLVIPERIRIGNEDSWIEASPAKRDRATMQYRLDYGPDHPIGREMARLKVNPKTFVEEVASARTFITEQEAEQLRQQGLAKRVTAQDVLVFGDEGLIENELRMDNECAMHKLLDMVGDFALANCDLIGNVAAYRSGHRMNATFIETILSEFKVTEASQVPA